MQSPQPARASLRYARSPLWAVFLLIVGLLAIPAGLRPAQATTPAMLVRDIRQSGSESSTALGPLFLTVVGTRTFFRGTDAKHGTELWVTDGTTAGTRLVRDITPGPEGTSIHHGMAAVNETLFFTTPNVLWKSDGTPEGTISLVAMFEPANLTNVNGTLFFAGHNSANGHRSLWKSDGTPGGTVMVKDLTTTDWNYPRDFKSVNGKLLFVSDDGTHGRELWVSDGTEAGTQMVKDITPAGDSFWHLDPPSLAVVGDKLFFTLNTTSPGGRLWVSDGTEAGTTQVSNAVSYADELVEMGGTLYFRGTGNGSVGLWKSDGTAANTIEIKPLSAGSGPGAFPLRLTPVGNKLFFIGMNYRLWVSDGTTPNTVEIPGVSFDSLPPFPIGIGDTFYFAGISGGDTELWKSDGTPAGTVLVKNIRATDSSDPDSMVNANGTLIFTADDGTGLGLWRSDGTDAGTQLIKPNDPPTNAFHPNFVQMKDAGGRFFFTADDGIHGGELWTSDGTTEGTQLIKDIRPVGGSSPMPLVELGGMLYFGAYTGTEVGLWKSDGTAEGTVPILSPIAVSRLTNIGGTLFFFAGITVQELWKSDGTTAGTVKVADLPTIVGTPTLPVGSAGRIFFTARDDDHGSELWTSDGTAAGTMLLKDIVPGDDGSFPFNMTDVNGTLFFTADSDYLWKSDGTPEGTVMIEQVSTIDAPSAGYLTVVGNRLFFTGYDEEAGVELWVSDGTTAGTQRVKDINTRPNYQFPLDPANARSYPEGLVNVNGVLLFTANDGYHGRELWRSDGTEAGTFLVKDIYPGGTSPAIGWIRQVTPDGWALLAASDGPAGVELWRTDGTAENTTQVQDIAIGGYSSNPFSFTVSGDNIFFAADDGSSGAELWVLPKAALGAVPPTEAGSFRNYLPLIQR